MSLRRTSGISPSAPPAGLDLVNAATGAPQGRYVACRGQGYGQAFLSAVQGEHDGGDETSVAGQLVHPQGFVEQGKHAAGL